MQRCHYPVATVVIFLAVLASADGSWRSHARDNQGPSQHERGSGSQAARDDQERPQLPHERGSGSQAARNSQGPPQRPHGRSGSENDHRPTRCAQPLERNGSLALPLPNRTQNSTAHRGNRSANDTRPMPLNRTGSDPSALPREEGGDARLPRHGDAFDSEPNGPRKDGGSISNPDAVEGVCPQDPRRSGPGENGQSGASSDGMLLAAHHPSDGAQDPQQQHPNGVSHKGVILLAVGGVLLGAGLATLAIALYLHKRSVDRVRAAEEERRRAVASILSAAAWGKGDATIPIPEVVVVDCAEVRTAESDCVCLGTVVEAPVKLV